MGRGSHMPFARRLGAGVRLRVATAVAGTSKVLKKQVISALRASVCEMISAIWFKLLSLGDANQ